MSSSTSANRDTSDVARDQGREVKDNAKDAAANVAGTAGDQARDLKRQAGQHARGIAGEVNRQVQQRAEQETQRAGTALSSAGDQLRALAEGRVDEAGVFGEYVQQAAGAVNRWADTVQDRGLDGLLDDLRGFARQRPGMFLAGAAVAGVVAGRLGRNLREELSDDSGGSSSDDTARALPSSTSGNGDSAGNRNGGNADGGRGTPVHMPDGGAPAVAPPVTRPPGSPADAGDDADVIVGHQSADAVADRPADGDLDYEPIDVNRGRTR